MDRRKQGVAEFAAKLAQHSDRPVLIVDDNPVARKVLQHLAGQLGLKVLTTQSGEEALALMQEPESPNFLACLIDPIFLS